MTKDTAGLHKIFSWKNVLDIHQLLANQTDINTTVSSHLSGTTEQSCTEVSTGRTAPTPSQQRRCFSDKLPPQVTWPSARNTGLRDWRHLLPARAPAAATGAVRSGRARLLQTPPPVSRGEPISPTSAPPTPTARPWQE